jgi:anti-sigma B factor antagonist
MADLPLQIECARGPRGEHVLCLSGPLTLMNIFGFQNTARESKAPATVIDMTSVPYVDSAGIGCLMGLYVSHEREGRRLALAGVNKRVLDALKITRVEQFFSMFPTVAAAQAAVAA